MYYLKGMYKVDAVDGGMYATAVTRGRKQRSNFMHILKHQTYEYTKKNKTYSKYQRI